MSFTGRKKELSFLEESFNRDGSFLSVLYGRKGVGKTALCKKFAQGRVSCFLFARECSDVRQRRYFAEDLSMEENESGLWSYSDIFEYAFRKNSSDGKLLLVIDEFQHIIKDSSSFMDELTSFLGKHDCMAILISSSISYVENSFVSKTGRNALSVDRFLKVGELGFLDCVKYFDGRTTEECIEIYSILGGVPAYWECFDKTLPPAENIKKNILSKNSFLFTEGREMVASELRELTVYGTVLSCMAAGECKLNDIHLQTGYSRAKISVYLKTLIEMELVEKVYPFDAADNTAARKGLYRIKVPFLRFYYRVICGHYSDLSMLSVSDFYKKIASGLIIDICMKGLKEVCKEYLSIMGDNGALPIKPVRSGEWQGKNGNIDVILEDDAGRIVIAFVSVKEETDLKEYTSFLKTAGSSGLKPVRMYIFSAGHFSDDLKVMEKEDDSIKLVRIEEL